MKREINIHLKGKDIEKLNKDMKDGKPFMQIDGTNIQFLGFEIIPIDNYEAPKDFPNCCPFHKAMKKKSDDWFSKFPNCCKNHKQLKKKKWFKKEDYSDVSSKILKAINYTEYHISKKIKKENWYKEITDYIEYCEDSFGSPSVGSHLYNIGIKHHIKNCKPSDFSFPKGKRNRLIEFFTAKEKQSPKNNTDLNLLFSIFQKWIKAFPNLFFFKKLKENLDGKIPMNIIFYESEYNPYLGMSKFKVKTKGELVELFQYDYQSVIK